MRRISYILLVALSLSTPIYALINVVPSGTTEMTTLTVVNIGDSAIIEEGGAIDVTGDSFEGVDMTMDNQTVLNQ